MEEEKSKAKNEVTRNKTNIILIEVVKNIQNNSYH